MTDCPHGSDDKEERGGECPLCREWRDSVRHLESPVDDAELLQRIEQLEADRLDLLRKVGPLRSRVRELEGHLHAMLALDPDSYMAEYVAAHAALPSQEQPAAPPTSTPEAPRCACGHLVSDHYSPALTMGCILCSCGENAPRPATPTSTPEGEPAVRQYDVGLYSGPVWDSLRARFNACDLKTLTRKHVEDTLAAHNGNKTRAAKALGIDRRTLYRMLERWQNGT